MSCPILKSACLASVIVFDSLDIVFAEVVAGLNLDEDQVAAICVAYAMDALSGNINRLPSCYLHIDSVESYNACPRNDEPMLFPVCMSLKAQSFARIYDNSFNLVVGHFGQDCKIAPGAGFDIKRVQLVPSVLLVLLVQHSKGVSVK